MKPWLHKTMGTKGWIITSENGVEFMETRARLMDKLKEIGVKAKRSTCRRKTKVKAKYRFEIKKNGVTLFSKSRVSEETMWALYDLANLFHSQDPSLFTEVNIVTE